MLTATQSADSRLGGTWLFIIPVSRVFVSVLSVLHYTTSWCPALAINIPGVRARARARSWCSFGFAFIPHTSTRWCGGERASRKSNSWHQSDKSRTWQKHWPHGKGNPALADKGSSRAAGRAVGDPCEAPLHFPLFRWSAATREPAVGAPPDDASVEVPRAHYSLTVPDPLKIEQNVEVYLTRMKQLSDPSGTEGGTRMASTQSSQLFEPVRSALYTIRVAPCLLTNPTARCSETLIRLYGNR